MSTRNNLYWRVDSPKSHQSGLTLVELMVSLVLGLVLIGGVLNIVIANREANRVSDNLIRIQENSRSGFDFMARDLREAGQNPCGTIRVANVIRKSSAIPWWANWNLGTVIGIDGSQDRTDIVAFGTTVGARVSGTDAILIVNAEKNEKKITTHDTSTYDITLNSVDGLDVDDVVMACDLKSATIFQIGTMSTSTKKINYDPGFATLNCDANLGYPTPAGCGGSAKQFDPSSGAMLSKLNTALWYVGYTATGTKSLYRTRILRKTIAGTPTITTEAEEMIPSVQNMQIAYLTSDAGVLANDWVDATNSAKFPNATSTATGNWRTDDATNQSNITVAVRIDITLASEEKVGTDQQPLQRHLIHVVSLRSREPQTMSGP